MKMRPFDPEGADRFTVNEFAEIVGDGIVTDKDGSGYYGTPDQYDLDAPALPSEIAYGDVFNNGYGYVHWFNK